MLLLCFSACKTMQHTTVLCNDDMCYGATSMSPIHFQSGVLPLQGEETVNFPLKSRRNAGGKTWPGLPRQQA